MTGRIHFRSALLCLTLLAIGCAPVPGGPDAPSSTPNGNGISVEKAKEQGVYAADGDAQIVVESHTTKNDTALVAVTVTNISDVDEDYTVVLLSHDTAVGTADVTVVAGTSVGLEVTSTSSTVTHVRLDGTLLGEGVALLPVG